MKTMKNFFSPTHFDSIQFELAATVLAALMIALSIGTVMVMIASRF